MSKYKVKSLKLQLLISIFISFIIAVAVLVVLFVIGDSLLYKTVYSDSFSYKMADGQFSNLQEYVEKNSISLENLQRINAWCSRGDKVYLTIYNDDTAVFEYPSSSTTNGDAGRVRLDPDLENPNSEYELTLSDDTEVRAFLYYYAGDAYYFLTTVLSGTVAFIVFSICFISLINKKISYVVLLKQELDILSGGKLDHSVTLCGDDELSKLAVGIDQMRLYILKHQEIESQMRSANSELITAMSHDLRTPLTSLLAYLEIIERKKYSSEEQCQELIHKSVGQTMRIKNMADKMFEYFLAYATEWDDAGMETVDADELFSQILSDYAYSLESKGMKVETHFTNVSGNVKVNTELLQRAMDNLYSNLLKYADPMQNINIEFKPKGDNCLSISITNAIKTEQSEIESTSIGLITCRRIIEFHMGEFTAGKKGDSFCVTVLLPLQK